MAKSHGSTRNYKFGQKNHWRRTLWNEVLRRTNGREKREVILYLAGPQDLDRVVAVEKGVPSENLIAIDRSLGNVLSIRSKSGYAINAEVIDVLRAWPQSVSVCAIVLDFCGGMLSPEDIRRLASVLVFNSALAGAVLAVNLQRGRDHSAMVFNEIARRAYEHCVDSAPWLSQHIGDAKHRGFSFAFAYAAICCLDFDNLATSCAEIGAHFGTMCPRFFSYRSGCLSFDSVVSNSLAFSVLSGVVLRFPQVDLSAFLEHILPKDKSTVRRVAATMATRTRQVGA